MFCYAIKICNNTVWFPQKKADNIHRRKDQLVH